MPDPNTPETPATPPTLTREEVADMLKGRFGADVPAEMLNRLTELTMKAATAEADRDAAQAEAGRLRSEREAGVLLTGDEATRYNELKARDGFAEAPLKAAAETLDANAGKIAEAEAIKAQAVQDAAFRAAGLDPDKTRKYLPGLTVRMDGEGDAAKPVAVTTTDGAETVQPLADVLAAEHAEILPVIQASADGLAPARQGGSVSAYGRAVIPQRSAAAGPAQTSDPVGDHIARLNARAAGAEAAA